MIQKRVIVTMLAILDQHQAIERCIRVFAGHHAVQVIAAELGAESGRVRDEIRRSPQMHLHCGDVKCVERFLLKLAMIDAAVVAEHDLGDGVGEIGSARSDVAFDDLGFDVVFGNHHHARMRHSRLGAFR